MYRNYVKRENSPSSKNSPAQVAIPTSQQISKKLLNSSGYRVENAKFDHGKVTSQDFVLSSSNFHSYALRTSSNFNFNLKPPQLNHHS